MMIPKRARNTWRRNPTLRLTEEKNRPPPIPEVKLIKSTSRRDQLSVMERGRNGDGTREKQFKNEGCEYTTYNAEKDEKEEVIEDK